MLKVHHFDSKNDSEIAVKIKPALEPMNISSSFSAISSDVIHVGIGFSSTSN